MPHIIVKMYPGRSEQQKAELAAAITRNVMSITNVGDDAVSVAIEEVKASDWAAKVYTPDITNCRGKIYKQPGYPPPV
jgi:4-oxalocrotonate tautomerase